MRGKPPLASATSQQPASRPPLADSVLVSVSSRLLPGPAPDQQTTIPKPDSTLSVMCRRHDSRTT